MAQFKINFKDATCQYVEEYSAGKYGTKVKIYFCEGDAVTPKQYSGSVGTQTITADNIDDLKSKLDRAVSKRDKELEIALDDSKKNVKDSDYEFEYQDSYNNKDTFYNFKDLKKEVEESEKVAKKENLYFSWAVRVWASNGNAYFDSADGDTLKDVENFIKKASKYKDSKKKVKDKEEYTYYQVVYAYDNNELREEFNSKKEALKYYNDIITDKKLKYAELTKVEGYEDNDLNDEKITTLKSFNNDSIKDSKNIKDCHDIKVNKSKNEIIIDGDKYELLDENDTYYLFKDKYGVQEIRKDGCFDFEDCSLKDSDDDLDDDDYERLLSRAYKGRELSELYENGPYQLLEDATVELGYPDDGDWFIDPEILEDADKMKALYDKVRSKLLEEYKSGNLWDNNLREMFAITYSLKDSKKKFCDTSADDIINLFHEAYNKGRTWDWLKSKLPADFLNFTNKKYENIFPIQADRTGKLKGVNLTRPKQLAEKYQEEIDSFIKAFEEYMRQAEHLEDYGISVDTYDYSTLQDKIQKEIDITDSKKHSDELEYASKQLRLAFSEAKDRSYKLPNISLWSETPLYAELLNKGSYAKLKNYITNQINRGYKNSDYKEEQRKPIIYNNEGNYIRSDSKVGPLSKEAEDYIRKIMGESSMEEMMAKRNQRRNSEHKVWLGWNLGGYGYKNDDISKFRRELDDLKTLVQNLKSESRKEEKMDISVNNRQKGYYKWTGKGPYDYNGRYVGERRGGYEWTNETKPSTVSINLENLKPLQSALAEVLNSATIEDMQNRLEDALAIAKTLPRNNPKVAEIKEKIKNLLENRKNAPKTRVPLPDKKFKDAKYKRLKDGLNNKEMKEFIDLCKKLKLETLNDIAEFSKKHGNVQDQKLLEALRKEASK